MYSTEMIIQNKSPLRNEKGSISAARFVIRTFVLTRHVYVKMYLSFLKTMRLFIEKYLNVHIIIEIVESAHAAGRFLKKLHKKKYSKNIIKKLH